MEAEDGTGGAGRSVRLDECLVRRGLATWKRARRLLQNHDVRLNGLRVLQCGARIRPGADALTIDGKPVPLLPDRYLMLNKRQGTVCTTACGRHERVFDDVPPELLPPPALGRLCAVGRLDKDTEGLLILTTDGPLVHALTGPGSHVPKTYLACLRDPCGASLRALYAERLALGMDVPAEGRSPAFRAREAAISWPDEDGGAALPYCPPGERWPAVCTLTLTEGKFHQVKRMFRALGNEVIFLKRISVGALALDPALPPGACRALTAPEVMLLGQGRKPRRLAIPRVRDMLGA